MRIGSGFDAHKFADVSEQGVPSDAGISIKLGGVSVPSEKAILAHSDGDVILHALCDAILGALALGDIGRHFPDDDEAFKDIDSRTLLRSCVEMIDQRNMTVVNADITLIAEAPRVAKYVDAMCAVIAEDLGILQRPGQCQGDNNRKNGIYWPERRRGSSGRNITGLA